VQKYASLMSKLLDAREHILNEPRIVPSNATDRKAADNSSHDAVIRHFLASNPSFTRKDVNVPDKKRVFTSPRSPRVQGL